MSRVVRFISGVIIGGVVGAIAGLLLTPYSGYEMREKVNGTLQSIISEIQQAAKDRRADLENELARLRSPRS